LTSTADLTGYTASGSIDTLTLAMNGIFNALATPTPTPSPTPSPTPTATPGPTPTIVKQPADTIVNEGATAKFRVTASGSSPLTYQWRKNGTDIVGATKASYTTPATTLPDNGSLYSVSVTDSNGSVVSRDALLTVSPANAPPTIVTQPTDTTVVAGQQAKFSVTATGSVPLTYQWHKNGLDIPKATKSSYTTRPTKTRDNGSLYSVTVSNSAGTVLSANAVLTVQ